MIYDALPNLSLYAGQSERLSAAACFLATADLAALPLGRADIEGDDLYAMVSEYRTHDPDPARHEVHRLYADLQVVVSGAERVGLAPRTPCLPVTEPYDETRDIEFIRAEGVFVPLRAGQFLVLYPHEAHQPGVHPASGAVHVRKIVVKMRLDDASCLP